MNANILATMKEYAEIRRVMTGLKEKVRNFTGLNNKEELQWILN